MNLHTFEKAKQEYVHQDSMIGDSSTFANEEAHHIKQKIEKRKRKQQKVKILISGGIILFLAALIFAGYSQYKLYVLTKDETFVRDTTPTSAAAFSSTGTTPKTGEEIITSLKKHILVPEGNPQIAEVKDVAKLKETQPFFKDAKNGDIVILYQTTIFIYRPSSDIVIASGDISGVGQTKP